MKINRSVCNTDSCFMCKHCIKEWKPAIALGKENYKLRKGETIFKEGDLVTGVYFVYSGNVKVTKRWDEDKELIVRFASDGAILGHRGLGNNLIYPVSATLEPTVICFIKNELFEATLRTNNEFTYQLMHFMVNELCESERKMRNLAHMPVKGRVAEALLLLKEQFGVTEKGCININLSRQDLASFAGTTYETLFRATNELVKEKLIAVGGKNIIIINEKTLLQLTATAA